MEDSRSFLPAGVERLATSDSPTMDLLASALFNHGYQSCIEVCEHIVVVQKFLKGIFVLIVFS